MTSGLRKIHKYSWLVLLIVVPAIMIFSIKDLDIFTSENHAAPRLHGSKKISLKSFENDIIKTAVFENQIEIVLKSTLKSSSSIVYEMDKKGNKSNVMGQLTTAGIYTFNINNLPKGIIIYDDLKEVEITKLSF